MSFKFLHSHSMAVALTSEGDAQHIHHKVAVPALQKPAQELRVEGIC